MEALSILLFSAIITYDADGSGLTAIDETIVLPESVCEIVLKKKILALDKMAKSSRISVEIFAGECISTLGE